MHAQIVAVNGCAYDIEKTNRHKMKSKMSNIEKHRAFLDSLEGEKGLPDEWRLLTPGLDKWREGDEFLHSAWHGDAESFHWRRASLFGEVIESGAVGRRPAYHRIPNLKEKVKEFGLACMVAEDMRFDGIDGLLIRGAFRALCAKVKL